MKPLIDASYFVDDINIPNTDKTAVQEAIAGIVLIQQPPFLRTVLGEDLYWELKTAVEASELEVNPVPLEQKWVDLLDGTETKEFYFQGLRKALGYFCFDKYLAETQSQVTGTGEAAPKKENAYNSRPIYRQVEAYNNMLSEINRMSLLLRSWEPAPADYRICYDFLTPKNWLNL